MRVLHVVMVNTIFFLLFFLPLSSRPPFSSRSCSSLQTAIVDALVSHPSRFLAPLPFLIKAGRRVSQPRIINNSTFPSREVRWFSSGAGGAVIDHRRSIDRARVSRKRIDEAAGNPFLFLRPSTCRVRIPAGVRDEIHIRSFVLPVRFSFFFSVAKTGTETDVISPNNFSHSNFRRLWHRKLQIAHRNYGGCDPPPLPIPYSETPRRNDDDRAGFILSVFLFFFFKRYQSFQTASD